MTDERKRLTAQEAMDLTEAQFSETLAYLGRQGGDDVDRLRSELMDHAPVRGHRAVREEAASMLSALRQRAEAAEADWNKLRDLYDVTVIDLVEALRQRAEAAEAEAQRLSENTNRFPDLMARILAAKNEPLDPRIDRVIAAMQMLPSDFLRYQWEADVRPLFGDKRVSIDGDKGWGLGRQHIADTPSHIDGLADYIAAANPDTVAMLIAALTEARAQAAATGDLFEWIIMHKASVLDGMTGREKAEFTDKLGKARVGLTPPADASAALQAVKDAERNAAIEAAYDACGEADSLEMATKGMGPTGGRIRALRRNTKGSSDE